MHAHAHAHARARAHAHAQPNASKHTLHKTTTLQQDSCLRFFVFQNQPTIAFFFVFFSFGVALFDFVSLSTCLGFHIACLGFFEPPTHSPFFFFHSKHLLPPPKGGGVARRKAAHKKRYQLVMNGGEKKSLELLSQPDSATAEDTTRVYVRTCRSSICATRRLSCRFESTQESANLVVLFLVNPWCSSRAWEGDL